VERKTPSFVHDIRSALDTRLRFPPRSSPNVATAYARPELCAAGEAAFESTSAMEAEAEVGVEVEVEVEVEADDGAEGEE
jgi:hypothetical protein